MKSIKEIYKIGYGPSSSHTMGPSKAAEIFKKRYSDASKYEVELYGSLALTGKGHLTDYIIYEVLGYENTTINFNYLIELPEHPNALTFRAFQNEKHVGEMTVFSVGGGDIIIKGEGCTVAEDIYPHQNFEQILTYCKEKNIRLYEYVIEHEGHEIYEYIEKVYTVMEEAIDRGLNKTGVLPGELQVHRKAATLFNKSIHSEPEEIREKRIVSAYAFAVNEENASGGKVVTAPTCGASGVIPAVLKYNELKTDIPRKKILNALITAAVIGNVVKENASISGAEAGCQAEVGTACAMAAAAHAELYYLELEQIEYAAEIALEHHLGLTCDPVLGYVQIPCIERNAVGALRAIDASNLSYFIHNSRKISLDTVIKTMFETGKDINKKYRETSEGGLAEYY